MIRWGLGKSNGRELDDKTKMKVDRDMGILVEETSLREKLFPSVWSVGSERFKLSELKDMPELCGQSDCIQNKYAIHHGICCCNLFCVANWHRGAGCYGVAITHLKHAW